MTGAKLVCTTIFVLLLAHQPAAAQYKKTLGGVNLNLYCKTMHGSNSGAILLGNTAGSWRCKVRGSRNGVSISVEHACRIQYGRSDAKAIAGNSDSPYSWVCVVPGYKPQPRSF